MTRTRRVGRWLAAVSALLFVAAMTTQPSGGCIPTVGRGSGPAFGGVSDLGVQYTLGGRTCWLDLTYLLAYAGGTGAVFGALLRGVGAAGLLEAE